MPYTPNPHLTAKNTSLIAKKHQLMAKSSLMHTYAKLYNKIDSYMKYMLYHDTPGKQADRPRLCLQRESVILPRPSAEQGLPGHENKN